MAYKTGLTFELSHMSEEPAITTTETGSNQTIIRNATSKCITVFVSKYSNDSGDDKWIGLGVNEVEVWRRGRGWEGIAFECDGNKVGIYCQTGRFVTLNRFELMCPPEITLSPRPSNGVVVKNNSNAAVQCFVSKYSNPNGADEWFTLHPGCEDTWCRGESHEFVAFMSGDNRVGVFAAMQQFVQFNGWN